MESEFTEQEFLAFHKYKAETLSKIKEFANLEMDDKKKLFVLADLLSGVLTSIKETEPNLFVQIIVKLTKGEQSESIISN